MAEIPYNFNSNIKHTERKSWWSNTGIYLLGVALVLLFITLALLIKKLWTPETPFVVLSQRFMPLPQANTYWISSGDTIQHGQFIGCIEAVSFSQFREIQEQVLASNPPLSLELGSFAYTFSNKSRSKNKSQENKDIYIAVLDGKVSELRESLKKGVDVNTSQRLHQDIYDLLLKKEQYLTTLDRQKDTFIPSSRQLKALRNAFDDWKKINLVQAKSSGIVHLQDDQFVYKPMADTSVVLVDCQNYCDELKVGTYKIIDRDTRKIVGKATVDSDKTATLDFQDPSYPISQLDFERP